MAGHGRNSPPRTPARWRRYAPCTGSKGQPPVRNTELAESIPENHWHQLPLEEVLRRREASLEGLSQGEAARRLEIHGPNELAAAERPFLLTILLRQIQSPLIYILLAAALVTFLLDELVDTVVILAVVVLNTIVGFVQEYKAERALRALARLTAPRARVLREGEERQIEARGVVPGDVVLLESGVKVPADLRLFRTTELQADESFITGESLPVAKGTEPVLDRDAPLGDQLNMAFMGSNVVRGNGAGVVVATGMQTAFGRISSEVGQIGEVQSPLQARLNHFARIIALLVLGVTGLVFALSLIAGETLADVLLTAVATAVATVPEGLPVVITVALAVGISRMAVRNAIIRKLTAVETLGSCTTICSDKTGTLTRNEMTATEILTGEHRYHVTGVGYTPTGEIQLDGHRVGLEEHPDLAMVLRIGMLANRSSVYVEDGRHLPDGDPTEVALLVAAMKAGLHREHEENGYPLLDEIPFESDRQYMATLHDHQGRRLVFVKGAPERVVEMCQARLVGESQTALDGESLLEESNRLAAEGLRVLAMAYRELPSATGELDHDDVEHGLVFVGLQGMIDPPRPEAIEAIERCRTAGIRTVMITGDHKITAEAIARKMGIIREGAAQVLGGRELETMEDQQLRDRVGSVHVYSRASPQHKLRIVQQLRAQGEVVAVTGDGVNDAPALKQADIGVAMGIAGTDVAKEAADMVLADDNFATIYAAVEEGRVVLDNVRKVVMFLIPTGIGLVLIVIASIFLGLPLPFLPAQIIWLNLVTNALQDVAMAFEPPEEDVGRRRPRDPGEGVLTRPMVERTALVGVVIMVGTLGIYMWELEAGAGIELARTVAMTMVVFMKTLHIFNSRSFTIPFYRMNPLTNPFLLVSLIGGLGLHVLALYWGPLQFVITAVPIDASTWLAILAISTTVLVAVEVDKALRRNAR